MQYQEATTALSTTLSSLEYLMALSATFVSDNELTLAVPPLEQARIALAEAVATRKDASDVNASNDVVRDQAFKLVPVANHAFEEPWESDFFPFPIVFQIPSAELAASNASLATAELLCRCSAACLFNLGLCCQLRDGEHGSLKASDYYSRAWFCLEHSALKPWESSMLLKQALCMNLASCHQSIGQLDNARSWMEYLSLLLSTSFPEFDGVSPEVRRFFYIATILNAKAVAAPSA